MRFVLLFCQQYFPIDGDEDDDDSDDDSDDANQVYGVISCVNIAKNEVTPVSLVHEHKTSGRVFPYISTLTLWATVCHCN